MKYLLVVLLLALLAAVLVSARPPRGNRPGNRYGHSSSRGHHYGHNRDDSDDNDDGDDDDFGDDDDDNERSAEEGERSASCLFQFLGCYASLESVVPDDNITESLDSLRDLGAKQTCVVLETFSQCVDETIGDEICRDLPDEATDVISRSVRYIDYVCEDKLDELTQHWDCFTSNTVDQNLQPCEEQITSGLEQCETEDIVKCVDKAFNRTSECTQGASELFQDLIEKAVSVLPNCSGNKAEKRVMKKIRRALRLIRRK